VAQMQSAKIYEQGDVMPARALAAIEGVSNDELGELDD
jgi:hypothetical protein